MIRRYTQTRPQTRPAGFTLVELLVVMAILTVVVSGVVAVFLGSMKAIRQGYRHMDAYEMSRGAFQVMDRDLTGGFTSRDHGDYYSFYGAPYGMTFVGLASNFQGIGNDDQTNLTRVSYVIRQLGPVFNTETSAFQPNPLDFIQAADGQVLPAYVLIRYVERDVDNLDASKHIGWTLNWWQDNYGAEMAERPEFNQRVNNLVGQLDAVSDFAVDFGLSAESAERLLRVKKHELWLRMLRGNGPIYKLDATDGFMPYYLGPPNPSDPTHVYLNSELPDYFELLQSKEGKVPRDYIVATNIYFSPQEIRTALLHEADVRNIPANNPSNGLLYFGIKCFDYGLALGTATAPYDATQDLQALLPAQAVNLFTHINRVGNYMVAFSPFWNSGYVLNIPSHPNWVDDPYAVAFPSPVWFGGEGSPLLPRIPSVVHVRLHLRFPAPNIAAADIERVLDQVIDIPTGYSRAQMGIG